MIDGWGKALLADVEQAVWSDDDPKVVMNEGKKKLVQGIIRSLPASRIVDFANKLTREMDSPQFAMELQKIKLSPNFLAFGLTVAEVSGIALPENTETSIEKSLLQHIGNNTAPDALLDERKRQALDDMVSLAQSVPQTLHKMGQEVQEAQIMNREWPWKLPRNMLAGRPAPLDPPDTPLLFRALYDEADKRAREKVDWQQDKFDTHEKPWGDMEQVGIRLIEGRDDAEQIQARLDGQKRYDAVAAEIRRSFRAQRTTHSLRLWRLYWENMGDLPQTEATARRAQVGLSTVKRFFAEARRRGWVRN